MWHYLDEGLDFHHCDRSHFELKNNPLLSLSPHQAVPFLKLNLYLKNHSPNLENIPQPRLFAAHTPYASLPPSVKECSTSKIVYICRNPMDMFISHWHFTDKIQSENVDPLSLDEAFEMFCQGIYAFGPFPDHVLGYWMAKQENPNKIMFLKYEDLKEDIVFHITTLANFLGRREKGVAEEIAKLCSLENLKGMEVNKSGKQPFGTPNTTFFRKGEVGDWSNYLTPSMVERFEKFVQEKFDKSGLTFKFSCKTNDNACA
ncbi:Sulfotransferase domain - like 10 [Theobroma cacao]|nr:Sulfotransferase domain - like 10 [Theobroma cacao]